MDDDRPHLKPTFDASSTEPDQGSLSITGINIDSKLHRFISEEDSDTMIFRVYPGTERAQFDYVSERNNFYTTNLIESTAHMIKGCLDVGILCIHEAYMWGGIWTSVGTTFILVSFSMYNTLLLVRMAKRLYLQLRIPKMSYPDLVEAAVATGPISLRKSCKVFRVLIEIALFIELCSCCNVYQIMMANIFKKLTEKATSVELRLEIYILILAVPILFLCFIKKFKYLAPMSIIVDIFILICVTTTLAYSEKVTTKSPLNLPAWKSIHGFFRFCGVLIYSVDGATSALPIENYMTRPEYFNTVVIFAIPTVTICGILVGILGYWRFGESCVSPITMHMPPKTFPMVIEGIFVVVLALSFAIHFWLPLKITWRYVAKKCPNRLRLGDCILRVFLLIIITAVSCLFPNIMKFLSVIGNVVLSIITFIFPSFIHILQIFSTLRSHQEKRRCLPLQVMRDVLGIAMGFVLMGGGIYSLTVIN